jgi:DNA-directed RNA polymerase specialized sigma24 family protein
MTRLADGDRGAFQPVYDALWPLIQRFAARATGGVADGEDVAQAVLMKVFSRAAEFDPERDALSWVLGIAAYECRAIHQKKVRRREELAIDVTEMVSLGEMTPEDAAIAHDLEAAAQDAIGTLCVNDVETLRLVMAGERPDIKGATFRKRVERALTRLRAAWDAKYGTK